MTDPNFYQLLAKYNKWANESLLELCSGIPDDIRRKDCGVFYKSIHGILNHMVHADSIWLARFNRRPVTQQPFGVDLYDDFAELWEVRAAMDRDIVEWIGGLTDAWLGTPFSFTTLATQQTFSMPAWILVTHMFNHQTYHRGQLSAILTQCVFEAPAFDLLLMPGIGSR